MSNVTEACCSPPPEVKREYTLEGTYGPYGELEKAYIVGPENAGRGIVFVYDIFGFHNTTQQGADILSRVLNARVIMPDFAHGKPYSTERYANPPSTEVRGKEVGEFFVPEFMDARLRELKSVANQLRSEGAAFVGAVGLCWGGRLVLNAGSSLGKELDAVGVNHPAKLDEKDGENVLVPVALYPSGDDQIDVAEHIYEKTKAKPFGGPSDFKPYPHMHHGWSGAHAFLDKEENYEAFGDVYKRLGKFFDAVATA